MRSSRVVIASPGLIALTAQAAIEEVEKRNTQITLMADSLYKLEPRLPQRSFNLSDGYGRRNKSDRKRSPRWRR